MIAPQVHIVAHQGGAGRHRGNSLEAFRSSLDAGVDAIELDVHRTRDDCLVVCHDPFIRSGSSLFSVGDMTLADLRSLDGVGAEVIRLEQIFKLPARLRSAIQIDLKCDRQGRPYAGLGQQILALAAAHNVADRLILASFVPQHLRELRDYDASVTLRCGITAQRAELLGGTFEAMAVYRGAGATIVDIHPDVFSEDLLAHARSLGFRCGVGIVNGRPAIKRWLQSGIDRLLTDFPKQALRLRSQLAARDEAASQIAPLRPLSNPCHA